jgi:hypothetical protein
MYYQCTGKKQLAPPRPIKVAPTFFLPDEWHRKQPKVDPRKQQWKYVRSVRQMRRADNKQRKKLAKNKLKRPGHIPAYDEWPEWEPEHRALLAAEARELVRERKRAKRKRYKINKWWRQNS